MGIRLKGYRKSGMFPDFRKQGENQCALWARAFMEAARTSGLGSLSFNLPTSPWKTRFLLTCLLRRGRKKSCSGIIFDKNKLLESAMERAEFHQFRKRLSKTQLQMSQLLGTSIKAIHSYEQGWRRIPTHVERQIFFLVSLKNGKKKSKKPCWVVKNCPSDRKELCPAWEFKAGGLCWFINGTFCEGKVQADWNEKMRICRSCKVLTPLL